MADPITALVGVAVASSVLSASAQLDAGDAAAAEGVAIQQGANFEADQLNAAAGQERAAAQRKMLAERRRERIVQSNLQAAAAASGAGASDPTVEDLAGDIAVEGEYRALGELFVGEERARGLEANAQLRRFEGRQAFQAGRTARGISKKQATATVLSGIASGGSLYAKYGDVGGGGSSASSGHTGRNNSAYSTYGSSGVGYG